MRGWLRADKNTDPPVNQTKLHGIGLTRITLDL